MATIKKRVATFALAASLALLTISFGLAYPSEALAWDNCPKGLVNDPYPGACRRYVDTNGDDICDLSQSEPVESTTTTTTAPKSETTTTTLAVTTTTSGEPPTGDCPLGPCAGCGACLSISSVVAATDTDTLVASSDSNIDGTAVADRSPRGRGRLRDHFHHYPAV
jgi:ferredoxin